MSSIWTKICGITRASDAQAVAQSGADAIGLVFVSGSSREVSTEQAREIIAAVKGEVSCIGLFLDASPQWVSDVTQAVDLDALQFHGKESMAECQQWGMPYIKAFGVGDVLSGQVAAADWLREVESFQSAQRWLIDSHVSGAMGGTGQASDWMALKAIVAALDSNWVLAGGLRPDNVKEALDTLSPGGIDLSSGVESRPGIKDHGKIGSLMKTLRIQ